MSRQNITHTRTQKKKKKKKPPEMSLRMILYYNTTQTFLKLYSFTYKIMLCIAVYGTVISIISQRWGNRYTLKNFPLKKSCKLYIVPSDFHHLTLKEPRVSSIHYGASAGTSFNPHKNWPRFRIKWRNMLV